MLLPTIELDPALYSISSLVICCLIALWRPDSTLISTLETWLNREWDRQVNLLLVLDLTIVRTNKCCFSLKTPKRILSSFSPLTELSEGPIPEATREAQGKFVELYWLQQHETDSRLSPHIMHVI